MIELDRLDAQESLASFVKLAWPVLEPAQRYIHGWHIDAVCEHLEAITNGEITRLLINIPPGSMKSLLTNIIWPSWEWGPKGLSSTRGIAASHESKLAIRDCMKMRRLIKSDWYQARWPIELTGDQNAKTNFENIDTGWNEACAFASMTGRRGDRVRIDDPLSAMDASSEAARNEAIEIIDETIPTRLNNPKESAILIIMQRLHEDDPSGHVLKKELGYEHLCLPMEFEEKRRCTTSIGFTDPRKEDGELLFPERFPREVVERDKKAMGAYAVAGQFQQTPIPRGGGMFPIDKFIIVPSFDRSLIVESIRYWDKAGSKHKGKNAHQKAHTAGVLMHKLSNGRFVIENVTRGQWEAYERETTMKTISEFDTVNVSIWIEQEPGSGGKESAQATISNLAGYNIRAECPTGDKIARADPYAAQVQAGNVYLIQGEWNHEFKEEHKYFPNGSTKDQVDAAAGAFNKLNIAVVEAW